MNEVLNKALALSYIHSKIAVKNLEFAQHELRLIKDEKAGQMQHRTEKLIGAFNKLFAVMEKHSTEEVELEINNIMDQCWD